MPNHITNILDVTGTKALVKEFKNKVYSVCTEKENEGPVFNFNATVPCPASMHITCPARTDKEKEIYAANKAEYGAGDWYEWDCKYWGTKWNAYSACEPEALPDDGWGKSGIRFRFDTAWSPPAQWIASTAKQFPGLEFRDRWIDEGGGAGDLQVQTRAGEVEVTEDSLSDHDWKIEFDEDYRAEYEAITTGEYDAFIDRFVSKEEEITNWDLQVEFVKRVRNKDLPLLAGLKTIESDTALALIEERLKGAKESAKKNKRKIIA